MSGEANTKQSIVYSQESEWIKDIIGSSWYSVTHKIRNVTASEKMKTNKAQTIKGKSWFPCIPSGKAGDKCWD